MLFQNVAMVAKKLLVDDKIMFSLCQTYVSGALLKCKVLYRKILSGETLCFLEKRLLSLFKFCTMSKLLFSCDLLIGPMYIVIYL